MSKKAFIISVGFGILALYVGLAGMVRWGDQTPPHIIIKDPFVRVGPATVLSLHIEDLETGLREISVHIEQNLETFSLAETQFPSHGLLSIDGGTTQTFDLEVTPFAKDGLPRRRGPATLVITARDYSWRGFFNGNEMRFKHEFSVKFTPPRLEVLSSLDSIPQGGSGILLYRVSQDARSHGVKVGDNFFPGYATPDERHQFALLAFPHNFSAKQPIQLIANDGLGNHAILPLDYRIIRKSWRTRRIKITDRFIRSTVLPIIAMTPEVHDQGENLKNFLEVNRTLRHNNTQQIIEFASLTKQEFLWQGAFKQLSNSQVESAFADHRQYLYKGRLVDTQDHLGFDLAVTKHYPVEATNSGKVIFADDLGIYGKTIVIDHGYGLQSLYAHLSSFTVRQDAWIEKGQIIGRTGTTGLAAGDHLHFSLLLHGVQVNPMEWWDPAWVKTRITNRLGMSFEAEPAVEMHELIGPPPPSENRAIAP